ncbi:MAG: penicillin-binding protein, partial [Bacteroidota bacterium]|nr:penicillin-binding protein [Bacteroidota bacterium]
MPETNRSNLSENVRKQIRRRYTVLLFLFAIPVMAIFFRVMKIQFAEGKEWRALGNKQRRENVEVPPNRGNIYSRDGQLMASTVPSYALYMDFQAVDQDTFFHYLNPLCRQLSAKLGDRSAYGYRQYLLRGYQKRSREYLVTKIRVCHTDLRQIQKFPLFRKGRFQSGLYEKKYFKREKPFGSLASRTIGDIYGEFSKGGKNGLELRYDLLLRGESGLCMRQKMAGKYISVITKEPQDGIDLTTTIDMFMQDIVETALAKEL